jgi:hypothetical protein
MIRRLRFIAPPMLDVAFSSRRVPIMAEVNAFLVLSTALITKVGTMPMTISPASLSQNTPTTQLWFRWANSPLWILAYSTDPPKRKDSS